MVYQPNFPSLHGPYQSQIRERNGWVNSYGYPGSHTMLPGWMVLHQRQREGKRRGYQEAGQVNGGRIPSALGEGTSVTGGNPGSIRFLDLPSEIRLRIYELLVQRGCIFAFKSFYQGKHVCAATKIIPDSSAESNDKICSLMCANRQIKEEVCSVLYGDNTFAFKIGGENYSQIRLQLNDRAEKQEWAKVFNSEATPLWPLTPDTIRYVKFLTILVQPFGRVSRQNYEKVRESVRRTTMLLEDASQLKRLEISLRAPSVRMWTPDTDVEVKHSILGLSAVLASDAPSEPTAERLQFVLEPFSMLHSIQNVTIHGRISPTFAEQLKSIMTNAGPAELTQSPLTQKRKQVLRKRAGYSKRRRVDVPILDYWRPKYEWVASSPPGVTESSPEVQSRLQS